MMTFTSGAEMLTFTGDTGRGAARAEHAQGTPTQSHVSPSILVYDDYLGRGDVAGRGDRRDRLRRQGDHHHLHRERLLD